VTCVSVTLKDNVYKRKESHLSCEILLNIFKRIEKGENFVGEVNTNIRVLRMCYVFYSSQRVKGSKTRKLSNYDSHAYAAVLILDYVQLFIGAFFPSTVQTKF